MSPTGIMIGSCEQVKDSVFPHWTWCPEASCHEGLPANGMLVMYAETNFTGIDPVFITSTSTLPMQTPVDPPKIMLYPVPHQPLVPYFAVPFTVFEATTTTPLWSRSRLPTVLPIIEP